MKSASVSELKNHLSARLKEVIAGEPLLVTERQNPVAILQALDADRSSDRLSGLVAAGVVAPPRSPLDVDAFLREPTGAPGTSLSGAIVAERKER